MVICFIIVVVEGCFFIKYFICFIEEIFVLMIFIIFFYDVFNYVGYVFDMYFLNVDIVIYLLVLLNLINYREGNFIEY